jgi:hypothetical protein
MKHVAQWAVFGVLCISLGLLGTVSPAFSQLSAPQSEQAKQVEGLVNRAAAQIDKNGKAIFSGRKTANGSTATPICSFTI